MIRPQFSLDLSEEIAIDNFAGGGGWSTGYERATGRHVEHAINHCKVALSMHRANHPQSVHHSEDLYEVDPQDIAQGRRVGIAHFSPDCRDHSRAKGSKPIDKKIRGLVLIILRWAKSVRPRVISMENVREITDYGPCKLMCKKGKWGMYPDPRFKGRMWDAFLGILGRGIAADHPDLPEILELLGGSLTVEDAVQGFGYHVEFRAIKAYTMGAPTIRNRLYLIARCDGRPIVWPERTHENPQHFDRYPGLQLRDWNIVADRIDYSIPCPSIFYTKRQARRRGFNCQRPLKTATLRRIAMGTDRFVLKAKKPHIINLTHQGGSRVESTEEPMNTITGANRGEKALVIPSLTKYHGSHRGKNDGATRTAAVTDPLLTTDTGNRFALNEASLAPFVTEQANASNRGIFPADEPSRTLCAQVKGGHLAPVAVSLAVNTTGHPGASVESPSPVIVTANHQILNTATLVQTGYGEAEGQAPRVLDMNKPAGTAVAGAAKQAVVTHTFVRAKEAEVPAVEDRTQAISLLRLNGDEAPDPSQEMNRPCPGIAAEGNHLGPVAFSLTKFNTGSTGQPADHPLATITAGSHGEDTHGGAASTHGVSAVYLAQHNAGHNTTPGHPATDPISTISSKGSQQMLVANSCALYYGTEADGQPSDHPAHTIRAKANLGEVESVAFTPPLTRAQIAGARRVAKFLRAYGVKFEGEFATIEGFVLVDIGMRMFTPRELYRCQGFEDNYIIDRGLVVDPSTGHVEWVKLTKEQQIRCVGNSVCPDVACALVAANVPEMIAYPGRERPRSTRSRRMRTPVRASSSPALPLASPIVA